jgi:hypothetical protein
MPNLTKSNGKTLPFTIQSYQLSLNNIAFIATETIKLGVTALTVSGFLTSINTASTPT